MTKLSVMLLSVLALILLMFPVTAYADMGPKPSVVIDFSGFEGETYYPPRQFKILLYFPERNHFIVSDQSYERYAFDSYFTAKAYSSDGLTSKQTDSISVVKSYHYADELLSLLVRIILTIAIEVLIAVPFGFHAKNQIRFFILVNAMT